jgi:hypothetical protein
MINDGTSLDVLIKGMLYGFSFVGDEETQRIKDMIRDILEDKAYLADLRHLLGLLH